MKLPLVAASSVALIACMPAQGAAVIYEPFSQPTGALNGQAGGTGLNAWVAEGGVTVSGETLTYGELQHTGGQSNVSSTGNTDARVTTTSALKDATADPNGLLADGETLWFSVMFLKGANNSNSNEHSGFGFGTSFVQGNFDGLRMTGGDGVGFYTQGGSLGPATWDNGVRNLNETIGIGAGESALIIGKIEWGATAGDDETITIYKVDPTDVDNLGTGSTTTENPLDQTAFDVISFSNRNSNGTHIYDEIRFGAELADVIPVPEPGSLALLGLGGLLMTSRRRR